MTPVGGQIQGTSPRVRIFFEELLARVDDLQLAGEPSRAATVFVGGLKHLPVSYRMR